MAQEETEYEGGLKMEATRTGFYQQPYSQVMPDTSQAMEWPDTSQAMEWLSRLGHDEKREAKRRELEENFSFEGFQVARRGIAGSRYDPTMTVREKSITFNNACIRMLENATYINFCINASLKLLAIRSVKEGTKSAIRWCIVREEKRKSRQMTCPRLTEKIYKLMDWGKDYYYRIEGYKIDYEEEEVFIFELMDHEKVIPQHMDPETGKIVKPTVILPEEWSKGFGMGVAEHDKSMDIDLNTGFDKEPIRTISDNLELQAVNMRLREEAIVNEPVSG